MTTLQELIQTLDLPNHNNSIVVSMVWYDPIRIPSKYQGGYGTTRMKRRAGGDEQR